MRYELRRGERNTNFEEIGCLVTAGQLHLKFGCLAPERACMIEGRCECATGNWESWIYNQSEYRRALSERRHTRNDRLADFERGWASGQSIVILTRS